MPQPQHLDERLLDALDTLQEQAERDATKACDLVDHLDEIRNRLASTGGVTTDDIKFLEASLGPKSPGRALTPEEDDD